MTVKILTLRTEAEAVLLSGLLDQAGIPYMLKSFHDSAYDGVWQTQTSWGTLWADEENRDAIVEIYNEMSPPGIALTRHNIKYNLENSFEKRKNGQYK